MKTRWMLLITVLVVLLVSSVAFAQDNVVTRADRAQLRFLEGMIDHHQMALDMANDCLKKAETDSVKTLCQNIITAQTREIQVMRGYLLVWYGVEYQSMSMLGGQHGADSGQMGMMSDMMGMMENMSGMMEMMSGMMGGMGMMGGADGGMGMMGGADGGMGMMGGADGGMGMMGGADGGMGMMGGADGGMGMMGGADGGMNMDSAMQMMGTMQGMTMGAFLEATATLDENTPLMEAMKQFPGQMMQGTMPQAAMMGMMTEMGHLTLKDMREMVGHLEAGENATMMELMQHHMDVMAGSAQPEATAEGDEHAAHHPQTPAQGQHNQQGGQDHNQHQGTTAAGDPPMTMGMFAGLNVLSGRAYEIAWVEAMIDHHDDALHMAERLLRNAPEGHAELLALAQQIISDQTAEIEAMEALLVELQQ